MNGAGRRVLVLAHVPDWSLVRLSDGREGVLGRGGRRGFANVLLGHNGEGWTLAVEVDKHEEVTVIAYPAESAAAALRARQEGVRS